MSLSKTWSDLLIATLFGRHPFLLQLFAEGSYQRPAFQDGLRKVEVEIVERSDPAGTYVVLTERRRVVRTVICRDSYRQMAESCECRDRKGQACLIAPIRP